MEYFDALHSIRGQFIQVTGNTQSSDRQISSGTWVLSGDGRFLWTYVSPIEQRIICDGRLLWIYDPDLEQATLRSAEQALLATPLELLRNPRKLEANFNLRGSIGENGIDWVELSPIQQEVDFERIRVGFHDGELSHLELYDTFGQRTMIQFKNIEKNVKVMDSWFHFVAPDGVDVVSETVQ